MQSRVEILENGYNYTDLEWDDDGSEDQALVYEIGSSRVSAGFSGDDAPRAVFPAVIGRPKKGKKMVGMDAKDCFVGDEAMAKQGILDLKRVNYLGVPITWDLIKLLHHLPYNELCVAPEEHPLMFIESLFLTPKKREIITEILFEEFWYPRIFFEVDSVLSVYCGGYTTGCVLDVGYNSTRASCVYSSGLLSHSIQVEEELGGEFIMEQFGSMLLQEGSLAKGFKGMRKNSFYWEQEALVERFSFVKDFQTKDTLFDDKKDRMEYELPDGEKITISKNAISLFHECLFNPKIVTLNEMKKARKHYDNEMRFIEPSKCRSIFSGRGFKRPIQSVLLDSLHCCPEDLLPDMYNNVVLAGKHTMAKNFVTRFFKEFESLKQKDKIHKRYKTRIQNCPERKYSSWIGGSIFSSLSSMRKNWFDKDVYNERGAFAINRLCINGGSYEPRKNFSWKRENHLFFNDRDRKFVHFMFWCNSQKESKFWKIPKDVVFIILSFFPFDEAREDQEWRNFMKFVDEKYFKDFKRKKK